MWETSLPQLLFFTLMQEAEKWPLLLAFNNFLTLFSVKAGYNWNGFLTSVFKNPSRTTAHLLNALVVLFFFISACLLRKDYWKECKHIQETSQCRKVIQMCHQLIKIVFGDCIMFIKKRFMSMPTTEHIFQLYLYHWCFSIMGNNVLILMLVVDQYFSLLMEAPS